MLTLSNANWQNITKINLCTIVSYINRLQRNELYKYTKSVITENKQT